MVVVSGLTAALAGEVRSRAHAFKVYHTGSALYFACASRAAAAAWVRLVAAAAGQAPPQNDVSLQFSETDYSDTASDSEHPERLAEAAEVAEAERLPHCKADHKDKSKFGSLKKLTHRMHKEPSDRAASASLDRKYLRFFSRNKSKDDKLSKFQASRPSTTSLPPALHLSNPNLVQSAGGAGGASGPRGAGAPLRPVPAVPLAPAPAPRAADTVGLLTLEQFMLKKQQEERAQSRRSLRRRAPPPKYEKYSPEKSESSRAAADTWRESLRRNDKVHDQAAPAAPPDAPAGSRLRLLCAEAREPAAPYRPSQLPMAAGGSLQCSPLQYPPTFQPESYSLAHLAASRQRRH